MGHYNSGNPHLPHNFRPEDVAYTGTHDNAVTREWLESIDAAGIAGIERYLRVPNPSLDSMIGTAYASVARLVVIPMQDVLGIGAGTRMNIPGTLDERNWNWRFDWSQLPEGRASWLAELTTLFGR